MSSSIYQGLQSCLGPRLIEPRVLRLKLTPSKSNSSRPTAEDSKLSATNFDPQMKTQMKMGEHKTTIAVNTTLATDRSTPNDGDSTNGGWSFLQALSSASDSIKKDRENEKAVYVHPLMKQSSATLSEKSLEMCTESLGSETGSDGSEMSSDDKMTLFSSDEEITRFSKLRELRASKKFAESKSSFPPPLTSISGPIGIKIKPHREDGRLVLKAVSIPSVKPCFEVERGGGRLRLRLLKHYFSANFDKQMSQEEDIEEEEEVSEDEENGEAEGETEEETEENNENVGGDMRVGNRPRPSRCKEGGRGRKGTLNREQFLVST